MLLKTRLFAEPPLGLGSRGAGVSPWGIGKTKDQCQPQSSILTRALLQHFLSVQWPNLINVPPVTESLHHRHPANCCLSTPGANYREKLCFSSQKELPQAALALPKSSVQCPRICRWNPQPLWGMLQGQVLQGPTVLPALSDLPVPPMPPRGVDRDFLWGIQTPRASPWAGKEWPKAAAAPQDLKLQHLLGLCLSPLCRPINPPISVLSGTH